MEPHLPAILPVELVDDAAAAEERPVSQPAAAEEAPGAAMPGTIVPAEPFDDAAADARLAI